MTLIASGIAATGSAARRQSDEVRELVNAREPLAPETGEANRRAQS